MFLLVLIALMLGGLTWRVASYLSDVCQQVLFPFELDYGEGIVWQQTVLIPSSMMYGRIDTFPFIVFEYPPLYHLAVRGLMMLGADPLMGGRIISVVCTFVIAALGGWLVNYAMIGSAGRLARLVGVGVAVLVPLTCYPVVIWLMLMRVDMLAVALSVCGVVFAVMAARRPLWLWPMVISFVFAIYTKQTEIVAPVAALVVLSVLNLRQTLLAALAGLAMAVVPLLYLEWVTEGGFLRHILLYNVGPFSLRRAFYIIAWMCDAHIVYLVVAVSGLLIIWCKEIRSFISAAPSGPGVAGRQSDLQAFLCQSNLRIVLAIVSRWFVLSLPIQITVGKFEAWVNYLIEMMCVWSIPIGMLVTLALQRAFGTVRSNRASLIVYGMTVILMGSVLWQTANLLPGRELPDPAFAEASERLVQAIRSG